MLNMATDIEVGKLIEVIWEESAEENIWTEEGWSGVGVEKPVKQGA
jgi:hypothetical protein